MTSRQTEPNGTAETRPTLLLADDTDDYRKSLRRALARDYIVREAATVAAVREALAPPPDVILLDLRFSESDPDNRDGLTLLEELRQTLPTTPILMNSAYGDIKTAVECMRVGAADFVQKNGDMQELRARIARALETGRLARRVVQLEADLERVAPRRLVGDSPAMRRVREVAAALGRDGAATVLIRGETGVGKEAVARAIHEGGGRRAHPYTPVMLNALPHSMVETELFGYEAGAFTDARTTHIGYLERANGGVLALDEIGDVDLAVQVKLLRVLEEREFERLGGTRSIALNVQVIAMTNADLEARMAQGRFREDLYFRLKVHEIILPPLRERREDIPPLIEHFLDNLRTQGRPVANLSAAALALLVAFDWPGNIRQLRNVLESASFWAQMRERRSIEEEDLPPEISGR